MRSQFILQIKLTKNSYTDYFGNLVVIKLINYF